MSLGGRLLGAITGAAMVAAAVAGPAPEAFRFRAERSVLDSGEFKDVRQQARAARASGEKCRGSHRVSLDKVFSVLAGAARKKDTFGDWAFCTWPVDELAKRAQLHPTAFRRACKWLVKKGRLRVISRFEQDARRDESGEVRWKQRTNLYIIFLKPFTAEPSASGLSAEDVVAIASAYRNRPSKIARVLAVADAYDQADRDGLPWTDDELEAALRAADAEPKDSTPIRETRVGEASDPGQASRKAPKSAAPAVPDFEAFRAVFCEVRKQPRPNGGGYQDDLVGSLSHDHQLEIGAYVRSLAKRALATPEGEGCDEAAVFNELAAELARAYVGNDGNEGFLRKKGHPLTYLPGDLHECGDVALRRWKRHRKRSNPQGAAAPDAPSGPRRLPVTVLPFYQELRPPTSPTAESKPEPTQPPPADPERQEILLARAEFDERRAAPTGLVEPTTVPDKSPPFP